MEKNFKKPSIGLTLLATACFSASSMAGLFPWENWFYHLNDKKEEIQRKHHALVELGNDTQSTIVDLNKEITDLTKVTSRNKQLIIIKETSQMDQLKWKDYLVNTDISIPNNQTVHTAMQVAEGVAEIGGTAFAAKFLFNFGKMVKNGIFSGSEVAGETVVETSIEMGTDTTSMLASEVTAETVGETVGVAAAEGAIEGATSAGLASTGIGIFAAVGVDAIFGAINGAVERDELNEHIRDLDTATTKSRVFNNEIKKSKNEIDDHIISQMNVFKGIVTDLYNLTGVQPDFDYSFASTSDPVNVAKFEVAQDRAVSQYADLVNLRFAWSRFIQNHSDKDPASMVKVFLSTYYDFSVDHNLVSVFDLHAYWAVLAQNSINLPFINKPILRTFADGCPAHDTVKVSLAYAKRHKQEICDSLIGSWDIIGVGELGSISGNGYGCHTFDRDERFLNNPNSVCLDFGN